MMKYIKNYFDLKKKNKNKEFFSSPILAESNMKTSKQKCWIIHLRKVLKTWNKFIMILRKWIFSLYMRERERDTHTYVDTHSKYIYIYIYIYIHTHTHTHSHIICIYKARSKWYLTETHNIVLLANTPVNAKSLLPSLEQAAGGVGFHMNANKTKYMCFNQEGAIFTLNASPFELVNQFPCHAAVS